MNLKVRVLLLILQNPDQDGYALVVSKILKIGRVIYYYNILEHNAINAMQISLRMLKNV